jgi:hypothetical protein
MSMRASESGADLIAFHECSVTGYTNAKRLSEMEMHESAKDRSILWERMMNKTELIAGLQTEYQNWQILLDQIGLERMDQSGVAGNWSIKDIVAHLTGWRRRTVARLQAVQRGESEPPPPWPAHLHNDDEINDWIYQSRKSYSARQVLDESHQIFLELLAAIEAIPEEVLADAQRFPWLEGQPIRAPAFFAHFHEEHEPDMRAWLARVEKQ